MVMVMSPGQCGTEHELSIAVELRIAMDALLGAKFAARCKGALLLLGLGACLV